MTINKYVNGKLSGSQLMFFSSMASGLDYAEKNVEVAKSNFNRAMDELTRLTGFELWHTDTRGGKWFWRDGKYESKQYASRFEALLALYDDDFDWH
jgi:hypothetical protein